eukprot:jgi/Botrbrau1/22318/Bobra.0782s0001.1
MATNLRKWSGAQCGILLALAALQARSASACPPGRGGDSCQFSLSTLFFEHASEVYDLKSDLRPSHITGSSTIMMAKYLQSQRQGVIVAVDTWLGALEFWDRRLTNGIRDDTRDLVWHHGFPSVYYTFLSNVVHSGVADYVIPSRRHDIELWWRNLRPGGILLGDDYQDFWAGVKQAANEFSNKTGLQLFVDGTKWWVHKPA